MHQQEFETLVKEFPAAPTMFEFNSGSWRNGPYWKARRDRSKPLTNAEVKQQLAFFDADFEVIGQKGLKLLDGVPMPPACIKLRERLGGKTFTDLTPSEKRLETARKRLERTAPRYTQKQILKQWQKEWDYWKKRAERDARNLREMRI